MPFLKYLFTLMFVLTLVAGCASGPRPDTSSNSMASATDGPFKLGPGDMVQIDVWNNPEVSTSAPVRPDGMISTPLVGDVRAGGRTPEELAKVVEQGLSEYIRDPEATVIVTELNSNEFKYRVRATGAVEDPLSMPHRAGMTVLDLVLEAGGTTKFASAGNAKLYRKSAEGERQTFPVDLGAILEDGDLDTNYQLKPGDVVAVPERLF
jgi:polysaccharide export outer membrane protein